MAPSPNDPDRVIAEIARERKRLVTRGQLVAAGFSPAAIGRRVSAGRLIHVLPGVYAVGVALIDEPTFLTASLLAAGEQSALIGQSAGGVLGIVDPLPGVAFVGRPARGRKGRWRTSLRLADGKHGFVDVSRAADVAEHTKIVDGLRVATVSRTLIDLAGESERLFNAGWREAEFLRLLDITSLQALVDGPCRRPGHTLIRAKLRDHLEIDVGAHGVDSLAELDAVKMVIRSGAPHPEINRSMWVCGRRRRPDLYWPHAYLIVEIDGWQGHKSRTSFEDDRRRDADFLSIGILTLRFSWRQATHEPDWCAERILQQIAMRTAC